MRCPLICLYAVEFHLPLRVMTQFGLFQDTPSKWKDTGVALHGLDKMKQKKIKNWESYHDKFIKKWNYVVRVWLMITDKYISKSTMKPHLTNIFVSFLASPVWSYARLLMRRAYWRRPHVLTGLPTLSTTGSSERADKPDSIL
ncbi:hypothetical protein ACQJBY_003081 [Aegilops geniculata]